MNNQQLQIAIDASREFLKNIGNSSGPLYEARQNTQIHLKKLEEIQLIRAGLMTKPTLTVGEK
jgi:hypothetical protein